MIKNVNLLQFSVTLNVKHVMLQILIIVQPVFMNKNGLLG